jgi:hypothetical protein
MQWKAMVEVFTGRQAYRLQLIEEDKHVLAGLLAGHALAGLLTGLWCLLAKDVDGKIQDDLMYPIHKHTILISC